MVHQFSDSLGCSTCLRRVTIHAKTANPQRGALGERLGVWRQQFEQQHKLQQDIAAQCVALQTLEQEQAEHSRKLTALNGVVDTAEKERIFGDTALQAIQAEQDQRLSGQTLADLRQHWQNEQANLSRWQQLETLAQRRRELAAQQTALASQLQQGQSKIEAQEKVLVAQREQYKELQAQVDDKEKLLDQERRIQSLEIHRQHLQPGEACPLCGSPEHPAIAAYHALDVSATEAAWMEKKAALSLPFLMNCLAGN